MATSYPLPKSLTIDGKHYTGLQWETAPDMSGSVCRINIDRTFESLEAAEDWALFRDEFVCPWGRKPEMLDAQGNALLKVGPNDWL